MSYNDNVRNVEDTTMIKLNLEAPGTYWWRWAKKGDKSIKQFRGVTPLYIKQGTRTIAAVMIKSIVTIKERIHLNENA